MALQGYRRERERLTDVLADALYAHGVYFPISEIGENLIDLDPFTFMAAFSQKMPHKSQQRLIHHLGEQLGLVFEEEIDFTGAPTVAPYQLRFFSNRQTQAVERELLWDMLEALLLLADSADSAQASIEDIGRLSKDYSRMNPAGKDGLQWAFYWLCPFHHQSLIEMLGRTYPTEEFTAALKDSTRSTKPQVSIPAFDKLVKRYVGDHRQIAAEQVSKWRTVARFNRLFDNKAPEFHHMLKEALGEDNCLLPNYNSFYPYTEILRLAKLAPKEVCEAFWGLLDAQSNLPSRVLHFCNSITLLYERYRDHFAHWQAKPCAHASFFVASIYLFMFDPERYFLYSPIRAERLSRAVRYGAVFRSTDADVVEIYADMCEQLAAYLADLGGVHGRANCDVPAYVTQLADIKRQLTAASGIADSHSHLILDDIIVACFDI